MQSAAPRDIVLNQFRRHPRLRVPMPFCCSLEWVERRGWFNRRAESLGVVYDLSLRGVRVSTEAPIRPGDHVSLKLRLPKQAAPADISLATVRWTKDHVYGLAFTRVTPSAQSRLRKYLALVGTRT